MFHVKIKNLKNVKKVLNITLSGNTFKENILYKKGDLYFIH